MNTAAALGAGRVRLSVDVANLSYRLALLEAIQDELRSLLVFDAPDGPQKLVDPNLWQRRIPAANVPSAPVSVLETKAEQTEEQATEFKAILKERILHPQHEIVLTEEQADAVIRIITAMEELL